MKKKEEKRSKQETFQAAAEGEPRQRREVKQPESVPVSPSEKPTDPVDCLCQIIDQVASSATCRGGMADQTLTQKLGKELTELRKLVKEREDFLKTLQRVQADFSNYQKRVKRDKEEWQKYQHEDIVKELLPALDNLGRSTNLKCESAEAKSLLEGVELTRREILRILKKNGVTMIKLQHVRPEGLPDGKAGLVSEGKEKFNPAFHEAVATIESTDDPPGTILEEVKPGFMLYDRVLRPSQVKVTVVPKTESTSPDVPETNKQG